ncbi:hypothetical protein R1flu_008956 [Riccia fluitans]|uniref:Uncharacterized protein n=1 Tax=Riccia fluitans TaxID=41844 RepID=A0ABD1Z0P7_9MARC
METSDHDFLQSCISEYALLDMVSKAQLLQSLYSYLSSVAATMSVKEDSSLSASVGTTTIRLKFTEIIQLHNLLMQELQHQTDFFTKPHSIRSQAEGQRFDEILSRNLCLEVFIDEILLFPSSLRYLGARFLALKDDTHLFFKRENMMTSFSGCTGAALEAAFMHALLSCLSKMRMQDTIESAAEESGVLNLSLPAGLVLLESLASENIPQTYTSHIIQLVTRVLNSSTARSIDVISDSAIFDDCSVCGGVDWSYCLRKLGEKLGEKRDPMDYWVPKGRCLPSISTVHFASSIFEQAMLLHRKFSTSSSFSIDGGNSGLAADNLFFRFCVSKYSSLRDISCRESEAETEKSAAQREYLSIHLHEFEKAMPEILSNGSTVISSDIPKSCKCHDRKTNHSCEEDERSRRGRASALVSAVVQLGIGSLECMTGEIGKMLRLSSDGCHQLSNGESVSAAISEGDVDNMFAYLSFHISSFLSHENESPAELHDDLSAAKVDSHALKSPGQRSLISSIGKVILFFTNLFCREVQSGAPEQLLEDYFRLLESFVALLLLVDRSKRLLPSFEKNSVARNESEVPPENSCVETLQRYNSNASSWLGAMVLRLESLLQELLLQKRPLPEFFLNFVLEQITRGDGLNLVAVALSGCFKSTLVPRNRHQSVITGASQSKGLVNQILELSLQETNRQSSILSLIWYMKNALEDLMPIRETLSLKEVSETVSCYEHIASVFTVACQVVITADDSENRFRLFSRLCDGIQRLLVEGTSVAEQIRDWGVLETIPAVSTDTKMDDSGDASDYDETWLQCCCSFLAQIDLLRRALDATLDATDWFLKPDFEFASVASKSRTFLEAVSRLMTTRDKPVRLQKVFLFLQEHFLAVCPLSDFTLPLRQNEQDAVTDNQHENDEGLVVSDRTPHFQGIPVRTRFAPEANEPGDSCVQNLDTAVGTACPSERGSLQPDLAQDVGSIENTEMDLDGVVEAETIPHGPSSGPVDLVEPTSSKTKLSGCSSTTLAIVKKLTDVRQLPCRKVKRKIRGFSERYEGLDIIPLMSREPGKEGREIKQTRHTDDVTAIAVVASNPYIETVREDGEEAFDDLKDFIVCKKGRNYATWLKNRQFIRRRLYARTVFKRLQQKRDLQVLLDLFV